MPRARGDKPSHSRLRKTRTLARVALRRAPSSEIISPGTPSHDTTTVLAPAAGAKPAQDRTGVSHEHLFSEHLETIDGVITLVCRLHNASKDYRNSKWGKWRPTVAATRHGDVGKLLEQYRYGIG